jgi:NDP-sugar pyrophosphorylase family protein
MLRRAGVQEVAVNLHHLPETVKAALSADDATLHYSFEEQILGTAGAVGKLRRFLEGAPFVVCNAKIYFEQDLSEVLELHRCSDALATLVVAPPAPDSPFNPVLLDEDDNLIGFGTRGGNQPGREFVFTGVQVLSPEVLDFITESPSDSVRDVYPRLLAASRRVRAFVSRAYWCETSVPLRYLDKSVEILARRGLHNLHAGPVGADCSQVVSGLDVWAPATSRLERCILWDGVQVGPDSSLRNVIVADNIKLPPRFRLEDAVVAPLLGPAEVVNRGRGRDGLGVWPLTQWE